MRRRKPSLEPKPKTWNKLRPGAHGFAFMFSPSPSLKNQQQKRTDMAESESVQKARIKSLLNKCLTNEERFQLLVTLARDDSYSSQVISCVFVEIIALKKVVIIRNYLKLVLRADVIRLKEATRCAGSPADLHGAMPSAFYCPFIMKSIS